MPSAPAKPSGSEEAASTAPSRAQPSQPQPSPPSTRTAPAPQRVVGSVVSPKPAVPPALSGGLTGSYSGSLHIPVPDSDVPATAVLQEQAGVVNGCLKLSRPLRGSGPFRGVTQGPQMLATVFFSGGRTELRGQLAGEELRGSYLIVDSGNLRQGTFVFRRQSASGQIVAFDASNCPAD